MQCFIQITEILVLWLFGPFGNNACCPWSHGLRPNKKLLVSVALPPAPVRAPRERSLTTSVVLVTSVAYDPGGCAEISWHLPYS